MLNTCLIILSCYYNAFDAKVAYACVVNPAHITSVQYDGDSRYMVYTTGKFTRHTTVKETPSQIKILADKCKSER